MFCMLMPFKRSYVNLSPGFEASRLQQISRPEAMSLVSEAKADEGHLAKETASATSLARKSQSEAPECRICLSAENPEDLIAACGCQGSLQYTHLKCLQNWCAERKSLVCELCNQEYKEPASEKLAVVIEEARARQRADGFPTARPGPVWHISHDDLIAVTWGKFWCHLSILTALLVGVLYLALFVNVQSTQNFWVIFFWRILTVVLPLFLIGYGLRILAMRTVLSIHTIRRREQSRRAAEAQATERSQAGQQPPTAAPDVEQGVTNSNDVQLAARDDTNDRTQSQRTVT